MYAGEAIESGTAEEVLETPRHPYTMGLTNAFPDLARAGGTLAPIAGAPPLLFDPPPGCRFAPRCPFALPRCREASPPLVRDASGRLVACWRADEADALSQAAREPATWANASASAA